MIPKMLLLLNRFLLIPLFPFPFQNFNFSSYMLFNFLQMQVLNDHARFVATAKRWTEEFAKGSSADFNVKVCMYVQI